MLLASLKSHFLIVISNTCGKLIYCNDNFSQLIGLPNDSITGQTKQLLNSVINYKTIFYNLWRTLLTGKEWSGILFHKSTNNKAYSLNATVTPVHNDQGEVVKYTTICKDISNYYSKFKDSAPQFCEKGFWQDNYIKNILYLNVQGEIINASDRSLKKSESRIVGCSVFDFVNPINHDFVRAQIHKVFNKGKKAEFQSLGLSAKGNQRLYVSKINPVYNLNEEIIYATLKTVKQKTKPNTKLKAIETKYSNISQSINVGILVVTNSVGNIIEWNKGAELAFGYSNAEIIGAPLTILISKKHSETGVKELLKAKEQLDKYVCRENIELLGLRKNGEEFPLEFAVSHWRNGKEKFYCAFMLDISKRKALEAKLKKTSKDLELFLYRSAHDLKAPLTSAEGLLHLLKEEKLNKRVSLIVNMLDQTLEKGRLLLDDLAFASIISEKRRDIAIVDFQKILGSTMIGLKGIKNFESVAFHIAIEQETDFYFNRDLIDSILQNLIHNALRFAKPKTVAFIPTINILINVTNQDVNMSVTDNGLGLKENHIDKVFDLYFRVSNEESNGAGLGLYIVKRITDDFNGETRVESKFNKGTTFSVCLPNLKESTGNDN
ncbi:PAS domain S-box protein [Bizionia argentinensis JUB59]|uniref:histidine kinase n=1 Tax=Bizionia argentinensis JUB59 TaxID=1046627 RepID=G2EHK0_9FLAO|nr:PAS domain S-box protein [Bizionia argentinensis JUB59]